MATIPRSHAKKIAALKRSLTLCTVYTLDNQFCGQPTDPANAWAALERGVGARLTVDSTGTRYTVHVHSNRWYELRSGQEEAAPVAGFGDALRPARRRLPRSQGSAMPCRAPACGWLPARPHTASPATSPNSGAASAAAGPEAGSTSPGAGLRRPVISPARRLADRG